MPKSAASQPLFLYSTTVSDVGTVRANNQDSSFAGEHLIAMCDGMGGHAGGDTASSIAIRSLAHIEQDDTGGNVETISRMMETSVMAAHDAIVGKAKRERKLAGMGTTVTAVALVAGYWVIAHIGDSRAYLLHRGNLQRITRDHSLVADMVEAGEITEEQARVHPQRSVITRALGSDPRTLPDIYEMTLEGGDRLLLCSDGLSSMIEDDVIQSVLVRRCDPQLCANILVNEAIKAGGYDNVTAVVIDVKGDEETRVKKARFRSRTGAIIGALALLAVLAATAFGSYAYLNHVAFLTVDSNNEIVVNRGLPGEVFGIQTYTLDHKTGVKTSDLDLPQNTIDRLTENGGMRVDSVADADSLVSTWKSQATSEKTQDDANEGKGGDK